MGDRIAVVRGQIEAFKRGDRAAMRRNLADDLIWYANEPRNAQGHGGVIEGPDHFLDCAFAYPAAIRSLRISAEDFLTDGNVVMVRQFEELERNDGSKASYVFLKCYEFNDRDQIRRCWEVTNSDFSAFP